METKISKYLKFDYDNISEDRNLVMHISTQVESYVNSILKTAVGLNMKEAISFGNTGNALSFISKIYLLTDFEAISKEEKGKFIKLAEIRNLFAHNYFIRQFVDLDSCKNGEDILKYLEKTYKYEIDDYNKSNENFSMIFLMLSKDIEDSLNELTNKINEQTKNIGNDTMKIRTAEIMYELIESKEFEENYNPKEYQAIFRFVHDINDKLKDWISNLEDADIKVRVTSKKLL